MTQTVALTGNTAVALAMQQIEPDVVAAYPITPSTEIMQSFATYIANGEVDSELVLAESEHSALSACVGAAAAGGRVMTATSSQGLALMWEVLYIAAGMRLPIVISVANRALSAPLNIHGDHSDMMGARDSGCIQLYAETAQEAYDNTLQAVRIAEHPEVRLPVLSGMDGFIISHSIERMVVEDREAVRGFVGPYVPHHPLLDLAHPVSYGPLALPDTYMEHRRQLVEAMRRAERVIEAVGTEFGARFGRTYGLTEAYRLEDAEFGLIALSSAAGTCRVAADELRARGMRVGVLRPRVLRPFPHARLRDALGHLRAIAVLDRADSPGGFGAPVFTEVRSALYGLPSPPLVIGRVFGLGGRDLLVEHVTEVAEALEKALETGEPPEPVDYLAVRE
ncbi:MAG: pyruvate ferredoxin oxidoreductase [Deltaproteobacteria bacterium]|nr:pyruvate ferredoxin oxidoreductase [Deltaproteobacteria bacterium]